MAAELIEKPRSWKSHTDEEGYRHYDVSWLVKTDYEGNDGPVLVQQCPFLPRPGQTWNIDGDVDVFARCHPEMTFEIHEEREGESGYIWKVGQHFSTKFFGPPRVSGTFQKYSKEIRTDNVGRFLKTSSWEQLKGQQVEFDHNHPAVRIEQEVTNNELALVSQMVNSVNSTPMWGLTTRCVKLSDYTWNRKVLYANATATATIAITTPAHTSVSGNQVQTITMFGNPTGGGFSLMTNGISTPVLPYDSSASTVQNALSFLFGSGNVTVTGGSLPGIAINITFQGTLADTDIPLLSIIPHLTGGNGNYTVYYYSRTFEFDLDFNTFDRFVPDEGTKVLSGEWESVTKSSEKIGSGCRVVIAATQAGGALTGVKFAEDPRNAAQPLKGYGYPPSSSIKLRLLGGGGSGGILYATTDANGKIDTIRVEQSGDPGYPFGRGSGYSTSYLYQFPFGSNATTSEGIRRQTLATVQITDCCTLALTTKTNASNNPSPIKTVTLVAGGSGYPGNSKIRLSLEDPNAQNQNQAYADPRNPNKTGSVIATTSSTGVVTSVILEDPGEGYIPTAACLTVFSTNTWKLVPVGGQMPSPSNPQHFIKYKDREGNPSRTPLNGAGIPANSLMFDNKSFRLTGDPAYIPVRHYKEFDFLNLLQIPNSL